MQEHELWFDFAKIDLLSAKKLLEEELFPTAAYHCQQCAEKALKGFLVFHEIPILKTHDLIKLIDLCKKINPSFQTLEVQASLLTTLITQVRYPSEFDIPDQNDCEKFIRFAEQILDFAQPLKGQ